MCGVSWGVLDPSTPLKWCVIIIGVLTKIIGVLDSHHCAHCAPLSWCVVSEMVCHNYWCAPGGIHTTEMVCMVCMTLYD